MEPVEASAKVMFSVYRDASGHAPFDVIYYTELEENERDVQIARVMAGETLYDGFLAESGLPEGKHAVATILARLNGGEAIAEGEMAAILAPFEA